MKKAFNTVINFLKNNPQLLHLLGFVIGGTLYMVTEYIPFDRTVIHVALDDAIPFLPGFIWPYFIMYPYLWFAMLYFCFTDREAYLKLCLGVDAAYAIAVLVFLVFPTEIDFRPAIDGSGFSNWVCKVAFSADRPVNVFPSLHVILVLLTHFFSFTFGPLKKKYWMRAVSAVFAAVVCASTVLLRQHSVVDVIAGTVVTAAIVTVLNLIFRKRNAKRETVGE